MSVAPQLIEGGRDSRRASEAPDDKGVGLYEKLKLNGTGSGDCYAELRRSPLPGTRVNRSYAGALLVLLLQRCRAGSSRSLHAGIGQVLMDQRHRHSTLSHRGGAPFDRATTRVASCEYARQARLLEERLPRAFSPGVLIERRTVQRLPRQDKAHNPGEVRYREVLLCEAHATLLKWQDRAKAVLGSVFRMDEWMEGNGSASADEEFVGRIRYERDEAVGALRLMRRQLRSARKALSQ